MTDITVIQPRLVIEVTTSNGAPLQIGVAGAPVINVQEVGIQGPPGPLATLGDVDLGTFN